MSIFYSGQKLLQVQSFWMKICIILDTCQRDEVTFINACACFIALAQYTSACLWKLARSICINRLVNIIS